MLCNIDVGTANTLVLARVAKHAILQGYIILLVFWITFTVFTTPIPMQIILYTLRA